MYHADNPHAASPAFQVQDAGKIKLCSAKEDTHKDSKDRGALLAAWEIDGGNQICPGLAALLGRQGRLERSEEHETTVERGSSPAERRSKRRREVCSAAMQLLSGVEWWPSQLRTWACIGLHSTWGEPQMEEFTEELALAPSAGVHRDDRQSDRV